MINDGLDLSESEGWPGQVPCLCWVALGEHRWEQEEVPFQTRVVRFGCESCGLQRCLLHRLHLRWGESMLVQGLLHPQGPRRWLVCGDGWRKRLSMPPSQLPAWSVPRRKILSVAFQSKLELQRKLLDPVDVVQLLP
jgi:hypothetical protein